MAGKGEAGGAVEIVPEHNSQKELMYITAQHPFLKGLRCLACAANRKASVGTSPLALASRSLVTIRFSHSFKSNNIAPVMQAHKSLATKVAYLTSVMGLLSKLPFVTESETQERLKRDLTSRLRETVNVK